MKPVTALALAFFAALLLACGAPMTTQQTTQAPATAPNVKEPPRFMPFDGTPQGGATQPDKPKQTVRKTPEATEDAETLIDPNAFATTWMNVQRLIDAKLHKLRFEDDDTFSASVDSIQPQHPVVITWRMGVEAIKKQTNGQERVTFTMPTLGPPRHMYDLMYGDKASGGKGRTSAPGARFLFVDLQDGDRLGVIVPHQPWMDELRNGRGSVMLSGKVAKVDITRRIHEDQGRSVAYFVTLVVTDAAVEHVER